MSIYPVKIEEPLNDYARPIYLGNYERYPTLTDIKFITKDRVIVAHRYASKLYIIQLLESSYEIIDEIVVQDKDHFYLTESFEIDTSTSTLYLICYSEFLITIDIIENRKLQINSVYKLNQNNTKYHGIKLKDEYVYLTPSNMKYSYDPIIRFHKETKKVEKLPIGNIEMSHRIKDILFISDHMVLLLVNIKKNKSMTKKGLIFDGFIGLYSFPEFQLYDKKSYHYTHLDRCIWHENHFYVTAQKEKDGFILIGSVDVERKKICDIKDILSHPFPHGLTIFDDLFAYTSYDTSSFYIHHLSSLLNIENFYIKEE
jgi:hypothetical protein